MLVRFYSQANGHTSLEHDADSQDIEIPRVGEWVSFDDDHTWTVHTVVHHIYHDKPSCIDIILR